jgi:hypothetical protein
MRLDTWLLIVAGVLLPLWILSWIVMLSVLLSGPGRGRLLMTYLQYRAEHAESPDANDKDDILAPQKWNEQRAVEPSLTVERRSDFSEASR